MEISKYKNSKIYKIVDNTENQFYYVGSTIQTLSKRLHAHKLLSKTKINQKVYSYFNSIGWDVRIILIKECVVENKDQLRREEDNIIKEWLEDLKCLNMRREIITKEENSLRRKEYNVYHRKHKAEYDKEYKEANREKIKEKRGKIEICICGVEYTHDHKLRHEKTMIHQKWLDNHK